MQCGRGRGEGHRKRAGEGASPAGVRGALSLSKAGTGKTVPVHGARPRYQGKSGRCVRQFGWYRGFEMQGRPMATHGAAFLFF